MGRACKRLRNSSKLDRTYVTRVVRLAFLAPDIIEAIVEGRHKPDLKVKKVFANLRMDWTQQRRVLGFPAR